jgi:hypothetical protein
MSGKHVKRVAWRPRRLAPVLTLLAGFGAWVAIAAALVLLPSTSPAEVQGSLGGPDRHRPPAAGTSAVPPQTLRTEPSAPATTTASDEPAVVSRAARRTAEQEVALGTTSPTTGVAVEPTTDPGPAHPSPRGHAYGHAGDHPGRGHGPHDRR